MIAGREVVVQLCARAVETEKCRAVFVYASTHEVKLLVTVGKGHGWHRKATSEGRTMTQIKGRARANSAGNQRPMNRRRPKPAERSDDPAARRLARMLTGSLLRAT